VVYNYYKIEIQGKSGSPTGTECIKRMDDGQGRRRNGKRKIKHKTNGKETKMRIGKTMKYIRELLGIGQKEMAFQLEMTQPTLSRIETDGMRVGINTLKKISSRLRIPIGLLIAEQDELSLGREPDMEKVYQAIAKVVLEVEKNHVREH
jgi:transcriptional regulator with XRE-family HTH domain